MMQLDGEQVAVLQNKVDLVSSEVASVQHDDIAQFTAGTIAQHSRVFPISAQLGYNIDAVIEHLITNIAVPTRDHTVPPLMSILRSFDVNKPGSTPLQLQGGVLGGSVLHGVLQLGDEVEIRPGIITRKPGSAGGFICKPIVSTVTSLRAEENDLQYAVPGGLIGVGTLVDPSVCRGNGLVGQVLGRVGDMPMVYGEIEVVYKTTKQVLGAAEKTIGEPEESGKTSQVHKQSGSCFVVCDVWAFAERGCL